METEAKRGAALIGTSGWAYREWRGKFYPKGLVQAKELGYLAEHVATVEMNSPFYRLQRPTMYEKWLTQVPDGFPFAVKGWRGVTHFKKLRDADEAVGKFFASGPLALGGSLGPVLWQLPPSLKFDADVFAEFLGRLPKTHGEAAELARVQAEVALATESAAAANEVGEGAEGDAGGAAADNGAPSVGQAGAEVEGDSGVPLAVPAPEARLRYAIEPRNESFRSQEAYAILEDHDVALVMADSAGRHPKFDEVTADFTYVRLHGSPRIYYSNYTAEALEAWADVLRPELDQGHDCYVYFDNTAAGHAPVNAQQLLELLS